MGIHNHQHPLKVYLSDISPHSQAILEFFIGSTGGKSFTLVSSPTDAEIYITDFDYPGSKEHWETEHTASAKPCIVLSMKNPQNSDVEWVAKPITAQALIAAAQVISKKIEQEKTNNASTHTTSIEKQTEVDTHTVTSRTMPTPLPKAITMQSPFRQTGLKNTTRKSSRFPFFRKKKKQTAVYEESNDNDSDTSVATRPTTKSTTNAAPETQTQASKIAQKEKGKSAVETNQNHIVTEAKKEAATLPEIKPEVSDLKASEIIKTAALSTTVTPVTSEAPTQANEVSQKSKDTPKVSTVVSKEEQKRIKEAAIARDEAANKRWALLCGTTENIAAESLRQDESLIYNSEHYFQGTLIAGLRLAKQTGQVVQIKFSPHQFYVCHQEHLVFSPLAPDSDDYAKLCRTQVKPGQVNLHILTSDESLDIRQRIYSDDANFTHDLESFIWTSCLLTSRGRVPSSLDCDEPYLLKHWPNFTRIEDFPFAMKITAIWQKKPYKINEIAREMDVPVRYVIALYNGCIGLSLFETDSSKVQQKSTFQPQKKNGLIARLFGRLTKSESPS